MPSPLRACPRHQDKQTTVCHHHCEHAHVTKTSRPLCAITIASMPTSPRPTTCPVPCFDCPTGPAVLSQCPAPRATHPGPFSTYHSVSHSRRSVPSFSWIQLQDLARHGLCPAINQHILRSLETITALGMFHWAGDYKRGLQWNSCNQIFFFPDLVSHWSNHTM